MKIHPRNFIDLRKKSISFDSKLNKEKLIMEEKVQKNNFLSPINRRKSKFNVYENLHGKENVKIEKNSHAISLLHIIKTLKKAANTFKQKVGMAQIQNLEHKKQLKFLNDLSFFPDLTNKRFFLKRYIEKKMHNFCSIC